MNVTAKFAEFIVSLRYNDLDTETINAAKDLILDDLGNTLAGVNEPCSVIMRQYVKEEGGSPIAGVIGSGFRSSAALAALVNGTMAHALDFNASLPGATNLGVIVPAILAVGQAYRRSGREILEAFAAGYEVTFNLARGYDPFGIEQVHGQHSPGILSLIGATAAVAKLLHLDQEACQRALGIASSLACGLMANTGYHTKPLHVGSGAWHAVLAGELAQRGFTGNPNVIEHPVGFAYSVLAAGDLARIHYDRMVDELGCVYHLNNKYFNIKRYPCCRHTHRALDALLALMSECSISYGQVVKVDLETDEFPPFFHSTPATGYEGKFSYQYVLAAALRDGKIGPQTFSDEYANDPALQEAMRKIRVLAQNEGGEESLVRVTVCLTDGRRYSREVAYAVGHPRNPAPRSMVEAKYRDNASTILSGKLIETPIEMITRIEQLSNISELVDVVTFVRSP